MANKRIKENKQKRNDGLYKRSSSTNTLHIIVDRKGEREKERERETERDRERDREANRMKKMLI